MHYYEILLKIESLQEIRAYLRQPARQRLTERIDELFRLYEAARK